MNIKPGQVYRACKPSLSMPDEQYRRIKIVGRPVATYGLNGYGTVAVKTLTENGREIRLRSIKLDQLHAGPTAKDGTPRRNGYVLESTGGA